MWKKSLLCSLMVLVLCLMGNADETKPLALKFALKYHMIDEDLSVLEKFRLVQEIGYDGIEVKSPSPDLEALKAAMDETGLPIHGVVCSTHWKKQLSDPDEAIRAEGLEGFKQAIRDAAYLGADSVLLVPGKVKEGTTVEEACQRSIPEIRKALPLAEELNIKIALENVWNGFLLQPDEMLRFIQEINHPLVVAYFDGGNTVRDSDPTRWPSVLQKYIYKLDVKEYKRPAEEGNRWQGFKVPIGSGDVDWPTLCSELKKIKYSGWATAEVQKGDAERLREILANMKRALSY